MHLRPIPSALSLPSTPAPGRAGIHATVGRTGQRARLRSWGPAAAGMASVLALPALAAEPVEPPAVTQEADQHQEEGATAGEEDLESYLLPAVSVVADSEAPVTESGLSRLSAPLADTPQSVVVVPQTVMQEQRAVSLRDALRNVSGITSNAAEGGRQGDAFLIRGFSAQNDLFRDGGRDSGWYTRDTFNIENVEVFFGPSAVLFGRGTTGGAINLVTKTAKAEDLTHVVLSAGSAPAGRVEVDVNRALGDKVQARINLAGQLAQVAGRDVAREDRLGVAPALAIQLTERTRLEVDHLYQREFGVPDYGQPWFEGRHIAAGGDVPRDAFYGVAGSDTERTDAHVGTARIRHSLGADQWIQNTLRFAKVDRFARPTSPRAVEAVDGVPMTVARHRFETQTDHGVLFDQLDLRVTFQTGPIAHGLNVGLDVSGETRDQLRHDLPGASGEDDRADLRHPNRIPSTAEVLRRFKQAAHTSQTSAGAYVTDRLELTRFFELLGSLRFDWLQTRYTQSTAETAAPLSLQQTDRMLNWRVGLVAHPLEETRVYAMAGTSSNPSSEVGVLSDGSNALDPEHNLSLEVGAKTELFEDRLQLAASAFRIEKSNARLDNPDPAGAPIIQDGIQRVQGVTVNASGEPLRGWKIFGNYTFLDSEIVGHLNPYLEGQRVPHAPRHSGSIWTTWAATSRLTIGFGATAQTDVHVNNPVHEADVSYVLPGFLRLDLFAAYAFDAFDLQLNVDNVTDALHYTAGYVQHAVPAPGRAAMLTARFEL